MAAHPTLLAFGFGNLAMLGWLAAAAAPLLIHLWSRHRFRETRWAAMQFLLAAMRKNARRMQLQQWLLLAVRTLVILLVVLAVAEPYGAGLVAGGAASLATHKVLVIDASYSMAYREGDLTRLERAKLLAAELVRRSSAGDAFTLILLAEPARTILGREVVDVDSIAGQIESLRQGFTTGNLASALALVQEALDANAADARGPRRQEVYFFTDLQRATWQAQIAKMPGSHAPPGSHALRGNQITGRSSGHSSETNENSSSRVTPIVADDRSHAERGNVPATERGNGTANELWAALAGRAALVVVDVGVPRAANLAVTRLTASEPFATVGREIAFTATLRQYGDQPRDDCVVELLVDDVPVGEQTVDVPAGGEASVRFSHRFRSPGSHAVVLRAAGDELPIDNSRWLAVNVQQRVRVLCVAGRQRAAQYVAQALAPDPAAPGAIDPVIVSDGDLADVELSNFDCIFLCNVAQLTASEAERLARYASGGGGIVVFLGDRVIADVYNALALPVQPTATDANDRPDPPQPANPEVTRPAAPFFPVTIGPVATATDFGIDPLDYRHPIVAPFRGRERAGLLTTPIRRYFRLSTQRTATNVEVAAALSGGDPLIVAAPLGRGRIVVLATDGSLASVDPQTGEPWTIWPTWPSFLPIVRELLAYASGGRHDAWQQPVGTPLVGNLPGADVHDDQLQILRPDGRVVPLSLQSTSDGWQWSYHQTNVSGIYSLRGAPAGGFDQFAVNVDTAEGDLAKVDPATLPRELVVRDTWQTTDPTSASGLAPRSVWDSPLLWSALALMLGESFLAWLFGRGAA